MPTNIKKAKIRWHCRRGMLELDLIFTKFLDNYLDKMTEAECDDFDEFLTNPDPCLYAWLMGYETPPDERSVRFVTIIQSVNQIK